MKRVIAGLLYDTEKARKLGRWRPSFLAGEHEIYKTEKGRLFAIAFPLGRRPTLTPFATREEAVEFLVLTGAVGMVADHFTDVVEEA